jgi:drug/metabolite transporter (DMT)-like permease
MTFVPASTLLAGVLASAASVLGKLSSDPDTGLSRFTRAQCSGAGGGDELCGNLVSATRVACLILMIIINGVALNLFMRAMREAGSLVATVAQSTVNFVFSALSGMLLFGEPLPLMWWAGTACMACGIALLAGPSDAPDAVKKTP